MKESVNSMHINTNKVVPIRSEFDVPDSAETTCAWNEANSSGKTENIDIHLEDMFIRHIDFLSKVSINRINVMEAEQYISMYPEVLNITDFRGETVSSYAAMNRNAGLSWLFAKAKRGGSLS